VRAAGVFADVAADGAGALARGIRRVEISLPLHGQREVEIHNARLDHGALVLEIDLQDAVHAGEADHDAAGARDGAPAQSSPCAAPHQWQVVLLGELHDGHYLPAVGGQHDAIGSRFIHAAVVFVEHQVVRLVKDCTLASDLLELTNYVGREHGTLTISHPLSASTWGKPS